MVPIQPNLEWYASVSERRGLPTRCPYATVHRCPRYFQSVSLLSDARITSKLATATHDVLLEKWKTHELWPVSGETATATHGRDPPNGFSNFCPEVAFDTFKLFGGNLIGFYDSLDRAAREGELQAEPDGITGDWRWSWQHVAPLHYSDCPIYSILLNERQEWPQRRRGPEAQSFSVTFGQNWRGDIS